MRGDTSVSNEDIAASSLAFFQAMGAPVEQVSVGATVATVRPVCMAENFEPGQHVRYVPYHAEGDSSHPDCENGVVSSVNTNTQTIFVRFGMGDTAQGCKADQLI